MTTPTFSFLLTTALALTPNAVGSTNQESFNYPPPPREGRPDYFTVTENGQARCAIVHPADASKRIIGAASALATYLQLVTGARFSVISDRQAVPEGMAAIHVGDTRVGATTDLNLPDVCYGDDAFPNLSGYLIKTRDPRTLLIRGQTETATSHGVVGFLRRYAGIRHYWPGRPGSLGEVVPA
ncbi:MAG: hypothetical protein FJ388_19260, partial [Verrucomicrobia bacterium]|nr:hypothetical protein [Verrucomicrobiota bacterium]